MNFALPKPDLPDGVTVSAVVQAPVEVIDHVRHGSVAAYDFGHGSPQTGGGSVPGAATQVRVAGSRADWDGAACHHGVGQLSHHVRKIMMGRMVEELPFGRGDLEPPGRSEPEVGDVEALTVSEQVVEVSIEVGQPVRSQAAHRFQQLLFDEGARRSRGRFVVRQLRCEPCVQRLRNVFQKQDHGR